MSGLYQSKRCVCLYIAFMIGMTLPCFARTVSFPYTEDFETDPFQPAQDPRWIQIKPDTFS